ncbi:bifunctional indole-3-glycerol phosphate synthase/phosphoribosylanthranilate isomerase, partial [Avibacterium endocarditidis]
SAVKIEPISQVDRYVLDSQLAHQQGGTGQAFDWSLIPAEIKDNAMLAGGINQENLALALSQHCLGLDINSGAESSAGVKDATKLAQLFKQILDY